MANWIELSKLQPGARVRFPSGFDIFPDCLVPAGAMATVEENGLNEIYCTMLLKPDDQAVRDALSEWDGLVHLSGPERPNDMRDWLEDAPVEVVSA